MPGNVEPDAWSESFRAGLKEGEKVGRGEKERQRYYVRPLQAETRSPGEFLARMRSLYPVQRLQPEVDVRNLVGRGR